MSIAALVASQRATAVWWAVIVVVAVAIGAAGWLGVPVAIAAPGLVAVALSDARHHRIPNRTLALTVVAFAIAAAAVASFSAAGASLAAGAAAFAALAATLAIDPRLGAGDVKLAAVTGAVAAWPWAADGAAVLTCALVSLCALTVGLVGGLVAARPGRPLPLGPSLVLASLAAALGGLLDRLA